MAFTSQIGACPDGWKCKDCELEHNYEKCIEKQKEIAEQIKEAQRS
jgi:hypothetical protein